MTLHLRTPLTFVLPLAAGALVALALGGGPGMLYAGAGVELMMLGALVVWPWAAVPTAVLGGAVASEVLGLNRVSPIVAAHLHFIALGFLAVLVRRAVDRQVPARVRTIADVPMLALGATTAVAAVYGFARGNPTHEVIVAAYQLGIIPAYFFLATLTLPTTAKLRTAGAAYVSVAVVIALAGVAVPGRHGGLYSALALVPVIVGIRGTRDAAARWLLIAAAVLFSLDVVLSGYRAVWLAAAVAVVLLVVGDRSRLRGIVLGACVVGVVIALGVSLAGGGFQSRAALIGAEIHKSSGYRVPEAAIGLEAFLAEPALGQGLGQVAPQQFIPGLGIVNVGPVYHAWYVTVLANVGLVGLAFFFWALAGAIRTPRRRGIAEAFAFKCLLIGLLASAAFAGPTDGHWEFGLIPAIVLIAARAKPGAAGPERRR